MKPPESNYQLTNSPNYQLFLGVLLDRLGSHFCAVDVALRIDGDAFGRARADEIRTAARFRIGDVPGDLAVLDAAPADAALPAVVILRDRFRFGVGDVQNVVPD